MRPVAGALKSRFSTMVALLLLSGCAQQQTVSTSLSDIDPLLTQTGALTPQIAVNAAPTPDLLGLSPAMREFADRYIKHGGQQQRLHLLHSSLRSSAMVGVVYDSRADGTAAEAFENGEANCLTYAHLFVSLARYSGLNARYMVTTLRPEWVRHGRRVALRQHVNVRVKLRNGAQYVVDIDPVLRSRVATARVLKDNEAFALYHANLAMDELLDDQYVAAYAQAVRSLQLSGSTDYLWVNLGAIYRGVGQDISAEHSYMTALKINPDNSSAMNNLGVMYNDQGQLELAELWAERVVDYRVQNPYYHMFKGADAELAGEPEQALEHYQQAIALKNTDAEFYYRLARLYFSMHQPQESVRYTELAIKHSQLVGERENYQLFLRTVNQSTLADSAR
jgi:Flp pilus assembly protein TadD